MNESHLDTTIRDSGERRQFESGAVRDIDESKGRCDLMPLHEINELLNRRSNIKTNKTLSYIDCFIRTKDTDALYTAIEEFTSTASVGCLSTWLLDLSVHYKNGAKKYTERNWEKGIPLHSFIDSAVRHYIKYIDGWDDENHSIAFIWNILGAIFTLRVHPELDDIHTEL